MSLGRHGGYQHWGGDVEAKQPCEPTFKQQLESAQKALADVESQLALFRTMNGVGSLPFYKEEEEHAIQTIIGRLLIAKWDLEKRVGALSKRVPPTKED